MRGVWGKESELVNVMSERGLDVLCVTETKRKGKDVSNISVLGSCKERNVNETDDSYLALWSGVDSNEHGSQGVGLLLSGRVKSMLRKYELVSPRLLWARMKVGIIRVVIVACYAPVDGESAAVKDEFWGQLNDVLNGCEQGERVIVLGDLNGWVGVKRSGVEDVVGRFGDPRVNDNGERIVDLCVEHELFVSNTWFKHKSKHLYTWERGDQKSMIDLVLYDQRLKGKVLDTRVYRGSECGTDHFLVVSKVNLGNKWVNYKKVKQVQKRIKVEKLQDVNVGYLYAKKLNERLSDMNLLVEWEKKVLKEHDVEYGYKIIKDACTEIAKEVCGEAVIGRVKGDLWWNDVVKNAVDEKKKAYLRMIDAKSVSERKELYEVYKEKRAAAKVTVQESKSNVRREVEEKMQKEFVGNKKMYWKMVNRVRKGGNTNVCGVRNDDGEIEWDEEKASECWRKYFMNLFTDGDVDDNDESDVNVTNASAENMEQSKFSLEELRSAVKKLKNGKAAGVDGVTSEMVKYGGATLQVRLLQLFNVCFECGKVPVDWVCAVIVPLYKGKGSVNDCKNHRGISLLSIVGKLFGRLVIGRVQQVTQGKISEEQCGFRPGRGCSDQIFTVQQLIEKCLDVNKKLFVAFVDLEKAYDRVNRSKLWSVLEEYGVKGQLLASVQAMYEGSKACVRVYGKLSEWFVVSKGVRQGCVMSPWLFNIFMDKCVKLAEQNGSGVNIGLLKLWLLLYADDALLVAESEDELQGMLERFHVSTKSMDLRINVSKTKVMVFGGEEGDAVNVTLNGESLERVDEFVYLGRMYQENGSIDGEINRRVAAGRKVVGSMAGLAKSGALSSKAKLAIYDSVLVPTLLYCSESWVCQSKHMSKVNAVGMSFLRNMCGKTRLDKVENKWVMRKCGVKESVIDKYDSSVLRWFGHVERMGDERIAKMIFHNRVDGRRGKGRPRTSWSDVVEKCLKKKNIRSTKCKRKCMKRCMNLKEASEVCQNRTLWRSLTRSVANK